MAKIVEDPIFIEAQNVLVGDKVFVPGMEPGTVMDVKYGPERVAMKLGESDLDFICSNLRIVRIEPAVPLPDVS